MNTPEMINAKEITFPQESLVMIYGKAGTGKTTFCLSFLSKSYINYKENKKNTNNEKSKGNISPPQKIAFIDSDNSLNLLRLKEICIQNKIDFNELLNYLLIFKTTSFTEQEQAISSLWKIKERVFCIVIDSFTKFYREELYNEKAPIESRLIKQLSTLKLIVKKLKIPIILTSQVYELAKESKGITRSNIKSLASGILYRWCDYVFRLEKNKESFLFIEKPANIKEDVFKFKISDKGFIL